jgi:hypothetical protein
MSVLFHSWNTRNRWMQRNGFVTGGGRTIFLVSRRSAMKFFIPPYQIGWGYQCHLVLFPFFFLILFLCYPPCLQFSTVSCMRIYKFFLYVGSESRCPSFVVDISSRNRFALYKCERGGRPAPSSSWLIVHTVSMPYSSVVYVSLFLIGSSHFESEMAGTTMCPWFWEWFCFFVLFNQ